MMCNEKKLDILRYVIYVLIHSFIFIRIKPIFLSVYELLQRLLEGGRARELGGHAAISEEMTAPDVPPVLQQTLLLLDDGLLLLDHRHLLLYQQLQVPHPLRQLLLPGPGHTHLGTGAAYGGNDLDIMLCVNIAA